MTPIEEMKRGFLVGSLKLFDLCAMALSFGMATLWIAPKSSIVSVVEFLSMKVKLGNCVEFVALLIVWHTLFLACGLYRSKRLSTRMSESVEGIKATSLATLLLVLGATTFKMRIATLPFLVAFWTFSTSTIVAGRLTGRLFLDKIRRRGHNLHHIIILGTNCRAVEFARKLEMKPELGYRIAGFVDIAWAGTEEFKASGYTLCCDFDSLPAYLRANVVDEVAIHLPLRSFHEYICRVAGLFEQHGLVMRFGSDLFDLKISQRRADLLDGTPQFTVHCDKFEGWALVVKRLMDFTGALALIVSLTPLFAFVAILIRITSPGSVLFRQKRVGLNKRQFVMYKFRTMVPNAEAMQNALLHLNQMHGPAFKIKDDPRITRIGNFLRKTSIDELPQLFNVLVGDMSLVGPRAMSVRDYQFFSEDWQRRRFSVRPGITCLWQVRGRSSIPFEQWMRLDVEYIEGWSLWLDIKILFQTIPAVLKGTGAA
jgi:exopolysaccharide biosynthesis polyprenyl glycosylphosphotransferase